MKAAYDYYPFGMVMPSRMLEDQSINCIPVSRTRYVREVVKQNQFSAGGVQSITGRAVAIGGSKLDQMDDSRLEVVRGEGQADEMPIEVALPVGTLLGSDEVGVRLTTLVEGQGEIVAQLRWYPGGWSPESGPVGEDYEVLSEAMVPDGGPISVEAGNEDAPLPVQMRSNGGLALVLRSVNSGSGRLVAAEVAYETVIRAVQTYVVLSCDTDGVWGGGYQYGFNGKKKDDEIAGPGNSLDFGARMYDSRLGRWKSLDPLAAKYPGMAPYIFGGSNPILFRDPDGKVLVLGGNLELSLTDVQSLVPKQYREQVKVVDGKVVFEQFNSLPKSVKTFQGVVLLNSIITSEKRYGYSVSDVALSRSRVTNQEREVDLANVSRLAPEKRNDPNAAIRNYSTTARQDISPGSQSNDLPADGLDGQVVIREGSFWTSWRLYDEGGRESSEYFDKKPRARVVFHELKENFERTEHQKDYPESHGEANDQANNFSRELNLGRDSQPGNATKYSNDPKYDPNK
ncbi:MAG: hypothetical protein EOO90_23100 [Pedobacter sp.]|nr:MAG: hypothetical protein EOO90_23100 [Pedobacter sp.]